MFWTQNPFQIKPHYHKQRARAAAQQLGRVKEAPYLYLAELYSAEPAHLSSKTTHEDDHNIAVLPEAFNGNTL